MCTDVVASGSDDFAVHKNSVRASARSGQVAPKAVPRGGGREMNYRAIQMGVKQNEG